eukprot:CAMPEP_0194588724 /NCGR_PEP_ID=MMETSP0292-20121207/20034_1 /TAXON_ID=39354 /ORGANISM="Heterosigma akashiwo, Strain CCMP2393" /LENGTH=90 /DNA_ID=CAMNT_0039445449 /DNA_START=86 /DNA_END=356 /DNA_ORIENTATION=+
MMEGDSSQSDREKGSLTTEEVLLALEVLAQVALEGGQAPLECPPEEVFCLEWVCQCYRTMAWGDQGAYRGFMARRRPTTTTRARPPAGCR